MKWNKPRVPLVTKCCGSGRWANVLSSARDVPGGDYCYVCGKLLPDNVRKATAEDMRRNGIKITDEEFKEIYE